MRPSQRFGSHQEALPESRKKSVGPSEELGVVGRLTRRVGSDREALPRDGSGREALPECQKWYGGPLGVPRVVWRTSRRGGSGREALPK